jgi:long-chain acyl-CoA synthetase
MIDINSLIKHHEATAVITSDGKSFDYSSIINISNKIYSFINHRSLVFCLCKNQIGSLCGYVSFISNRVVPLMLESSLDKELLENLIKTYNPEYLWVPKEQVGEFTKGQEIYSILDYSLIKLTNHNKYQLNDDLALLLATSGSTGSPKLVMLTYENIKSNAKSIVEYLSIDKNERPITTLPMSYSFGLSIINSHLYSGSTILLTNRTLFEKEFWSFLNEYKATSFSGVPYTYEMLKKLRFTKMDLPSLTTLTQAGGKMNIDLNKEIAEFCHNNNKRLFVMYGQTEATARMSYLPHEQSLSKLGSMGIAIPGGQFSIINESGQTVTESNVVGELVYEGRNVSLGYAECGKELSKLDENKGVLITGDMAKRDENGFYYIVGRKKRFVKIFGNRINLDETERLLKNIVSDCACVGNDDQMYIYINDESRSEEVRNFISVKIGIHHSAFTIKHTATIPKNPSGKTIYNKLVTV